jgi:uncharacterized cupredoxin-like copper-binding protein
MSGRTRIAALLAMVGVAVLIPASAQPSHGPSVVRFRMIEWDIIPQNASKSHGPLPQVTFVVKNAGKLEHEFVVIRTNKAAGRLARSGAKEAPEKGAVGEIEEIAPGQTKKLALKLSQAHYALICNLTGHWNKGQFVDYYVH